MAVMIQISSWNIGSEPEKKERIGAACSHSFLSGHVLCSALFESGLCFLSSSLNVLWVFSLLKYNSWKSRLEDKEWSTTETEHFQTWSNTCSIGEETSVDLLILSINVCGLNLKVVSCSVSRYALAACTIIAKVCFSQFLKTRTPGLPLEDQLWNATNHEG